MLAFPYMDLKPNDLIWNTRAKTFHVVVECTRARNMLKSTEYYYLVWIDLADKKNFGRLIRTPIYPGDKMQNDFEIYRANRKIFP